MDIREELKSAGTYPAGPVSAWPQERNEKLMAAHQPPVEKELSRKATKVEASVGKMAKGLFKSAQQAVQYGHVSQEVRDERYDTCKKCPLFVEKSKRCADCGCFMEAKTWLGGPKHQLCPQDRWAR